MFEKRLVNFRQTFEFCSIGRELFAHLQERQHHEHAYGHGLFAAKDVGGQQGAALGEGPGRVRCTAVFAGTGHKL